VSILGSFVWYSYFETDFQHSWSRKAVFLCPLKLF